MKILDEKLLTDTVRRFIILAKYGKLNMRIAYKSSEQLAEMGLTHQQAVEIQGIYEKHYTASDTYTFIHELTDYVNLLYLS